jgi:ribosomal protein L11 methyltransferase
MQHPAPISPTQWWELYVQVPECLSEVISAYWHDLGSTAIVLHDSAVLRPRHEACIATTPDASDWTVIQGAFPADTHLLGRVRALQTFLQSLCTDAADTTWYLYGRPLQDDAYLTQWQQFFQPVQIGNRLLICPPWETPPVSPPTARLILEPGLAFGTGSHPTTYLALLLLAQTLVDGTHRTVLDVGCGSGILGLAALQLGAQTVLGVDLEEQAVAVAEHNATLNDLQHRARFMQGSWEVTEAQFDLLTANIYLGPLVNMIHPLAERLAPHGTLVLSGILAFQESTLRTALDTAQLTVVQQMMQDNWVALVARHRV